MNVTIVEDGIDPQIDQHKAHSILEQTLTSEGIADAEVGVIFGDDESLRKLKQDFFNKDEYTDVIAFRLNDYALAAVEGEIYISVERASENAEKFNQPLAKELARLIIHGGLHLLEYKDDTNEEKSIMTAKENQYLDELGWEGLIDE